MWKFEGLPKVWDGRIKGLRAFILEHPCKKSGLAGNNGYCVFPKRPVIEQGCDGILTYVPVHGGITLAREGEGGVWVYGFDTGHCDSEQFPSNDTDWTKSQIAVMIKGIRVAAKVERNYLRCITNRGKAKYCEMVQEVGEQEHRMNFGVNIRLLSGSL